jgi:hypothetical protein
MITHKDTIIQVTFTIGTRRYEKYGLQRADWAFVRSVNPYGYNFAGVDGVMEFLNEEEKRIKMGWSKKPTYDDWSYFKYFVLGNRPDGDRRKKQKPKKLTIWNGGRHALVNAEIVPWEDVKIEKVVAFDKDTDTETDITKRFMEVWNLGNKK